MTGKVIKEKHDRNPSSRRNEKPSTARTTKYIIDKESGRIRLIVHSAPMMAAPPVQSLTSNGYYVSERFTNQEKIAQKSSKKQSEKSQVRQVASKLTSKGQDKTKHNISKHEKHDTASLEPNGSRSRPVAAAMTRGAALCDTVTARLNDVLARLETRHLNEQVADALSRGLDGAKASAQPEALKDSERDPIHSKFGDSRAGVLNFKKTWCYANSRLPPYIPQVKIYTETWSILCRAAHASESVYDRLQMHRNERENYIDADWHNGTKAMLLRSKVLDDKKLIILAVRGSKWNIADWAVNFHPAPAQPTGFLDDDGNACHSGFLSVAKAMVKPVAARLRQLLEQEPSRASSSLVFTGHSAGGAVAGLLYMHMLSCSVESELTTLFGCFRRVHCVTFGTPPVSLLPLHKPSGRQYASSVFMSFANEGDPVVRADREYLSTLARIVAAPAPNLYPVIITKTLNTKKSRAKLSDTDSAANTPLPTPPWCRLPETRLSNAGRLVLLRTKPGQSQGVEAVSIDDTQLRGVVFGDPAMHAMVLYRQRIEQLAIEAVTGQISG